MVTGEKFTSREGPSWLPALLECEEFFAHCRFHPTGKSERNQFCFDCPSAGAVCPEGLAKLHAGHASIQIRRASHRDVVRVADIQRWVDLSNIQGYTINSAKIVFLVSRLQGKVVKGAAHYCEMCYRSIADPVRFCSILCKLAGIQEDPHDFTLTLTVFSKSGPGFFSKGGSADHSIVNATSLSPATSAHSRDGSGVTDFMPVTPKKSSSKRPARDALSPIPTTKKPRKLALPAASMIHLESVDVNSLNLACESRPLKSHRRKQSKPQRAPMF